MEMFCFVLLGFGIINKYIKRTVLKNLQEKLFLILAVFGLVSIGFVVGYYFLFAVQFAIILIGSFIGFKLIEKLDTGNAIALFLGGICILIGIFIGDIYYFWTTTNSSITLLR